MLLLCVYLHGTKCYDSPASDSVNCCLKWERCNSLIQVKTIQGGRMYLIFFPKKYILNLRLIFTCMFFHIHLHTCETKPLQFIFSLLFFKDYSLKMLEKLCVFSLAARSGTKLTSPANCRNWKHTVQPSHLLSFSITGQQTDMLLMHFILWRQRKEFRG